VTPDDDLTALLGLSVEVAQTMKEAALEAAKERHPAGKALDLPQPSGVVLTAADRCDAACTAGALYRVTKTLFGVVNEHESAPTLDWCRHHFFKHFPTQVADGWQVIGANPDLFAELHQNDRLKGTDHA
jgi:hypothetical protein